MNSDTDIPQVLIIKLGALGDLFLAEGAIRDIRRHHANARIHLLTRRPFAALMARCPWIDAVHIDENAPRWNLLGMWRWRNWFRGGNFHHVYDLQNSDRTRFYRRWLSGDAADWSALPATDLHAQAGSVPERHARQLARAGIAPEDATRPRLDWIAEDPSALLKQAGVQSPFVLLLPGSSARHAHKRWPGFAALSRTLVSHGHCAVTVLGPDEATDAQTYDGIVLRDGERWLSMPQLAGVAMHAACVVGNDSGPLHLAACLDAPCVALFERGNPSLHTTGIERRNAVKLVTDSLHELPLGQVMVAVQTTLSESR